MAGLFDKLPDPIAPRPVAPAEAPAPGTRRAAREAARQASAQESHSAPERGVAASASPAVPPETPVRSGIDELLSTATGDEERRDPARGKKRRRRGCLVALIVVLALIGGIAAAGVWVMNTYGERINEVMGWGEPIDFEPGQDGDPARVMIVEGDTGCSLSPKLFEVGVTKTEDAFCKLLVRAEVSPTLIPGIYQLRERMSFDEIIEALGDPANLLDDAVLRELTIERSVQATVAMLGITVDPLPTTLPAPFAEGGFAIFDREFFDEDALDAEGIQAFLDDRAAACDSGADCLKDATRDYADVAANSYCAAIPGGTGEGVAQVIDKVAKACGLNPKLLLVLFHDQLGIDMDALAAESVAPIADGGFIISDEAFFDAASMSEEQIQAFLEEQVPVCAPGSTCLKDYVQDHPDKPADRYCSRMPGGTNESAALIIHKVAEACGINPQVLLIMLEKEQVLVTMTDPEPLRFDRAMGFACPDTGENNSANCNEVHYGFANQVYRGARQMQVYTAQPGSFNYRAGRVNTIPWHPSSECGSSRVFIQNQATANLYIYTPYRPNIAGLAAGRGIGDACSSSGNRNFYNLYVDWFAQAQAPFLGAPAQIQGCTLPPAEEVRDHRARATVATTQMNARQAPSTLCTRDVATLAEGTEVTVVGQYGAWSRATADGREVWLATEYLDFPDGDRPFTRAESAQEGEGE